MAEKKQAVRKREKKSGLSENNAAGAGRGNEKQNACRQLAYKQDEPRDWN